MATKAYILMKVKTGRAQDVLSYPERPCRGSSKPMPVLANLTFLASSMRLMIGHCRILS